MQKYGKVMILVCTASLLMGCSSESVMKYLSKDGFEEAFETVEEETVDIEANSYYTVGQKVDVEWDIWDDRGNITGREKMYEYTVEDVSICEQLSDIDSENMIEYIEYFANKEENMESDDYQLIMCKVRVKNIGLTDDFNVTQAGFSYIDENGKVSLIAYPAYLDSPNKSKRIKGEAECVINKGEEAEMIIGYPIIKDDYPLSNIYLQIPYGDINGTYIKLFN